jgi:NADPH:quinone reductase-like Zn-dependent oxidoreductase
LGADELIDHQTCDFTAVVGDLDVVLDSLGGEIARRSISVLRPGGMLITIVGRRDVDLAARTRAAGRRFAGLSVEPDYPGLEALAGLVDSGQLRVHLQTTLPLAEAAKAHQLLESGRTTGKIALTI